MMDQDGTIEQSLVNLQRCIDDKNTSQFSACLLNCRKRRLDREQKGILIEKVVN
jgi:hypothetical protein